MRHDLHAVVPSGSIVLPSEIPARPSMPIIIGWLGP